jgi:hypothetical protein
MVEEHETSAVDLLREMAFEEASHHVAETGVFLRQVF